MADLVVKIGETKNTGVAKIETPKYANQLLNVSLSLGKIVKVGREYKFV